MSSLAPAAVKLSSWPVFAEDEIAAVEAVLRSGKVNYWTGTEGREFEREFAAYVGTRHGIAIANGTVTLELALMALGIQPGDEVILPPRTFMATATAIVLRGGVPVFADLDPISGNISAATIDAVRTHKTKAVIPVHLGGWPCEMDEIRALGIPIIEDCAQAHGAEYKGRKVGSLSEVASWSFCQDKIMTLGGEGGAITCDDDALWDVMWSYKDHGKTWEAVYERKHPPGFRWVNERFGTNWRLTDMQSAIARVQLRKLDDWVAQRRANAAVLNEVLADVPGLEVPMPGPHLKHAYYRWYGYLDVARLRDGWTRERVCEEVMALGPWCQVGSCSEIYLEKAFDGTGFRPPTRLPVAKRIGESSLSLRTDPNLTPADMARVAEIVQYVLGQAIA